MSDRTYCLDDININTNNKGSDSYLDIDAPFVNLHTRGQYDLGTLYSSIQNIVADKLPTLPGIKKTKKRGDNDFTLQGNVYSTEILQRILASSWTSVRLSISTAIYRSKTRN